MSGPLPLPKLKNEAAAATLCAVIYMNGKVLGRYAMPTENLTEALSSQVAEVEAAIDWAIECSWIGRRYANIELKAAGIYVAKQVLDRPR
jgi:hypothetical protein